jgi:hypothetical protein
MTTDQIRSHLQQLSKDRGALKKLCSDNDLPYQRVWKFTNSKVERLRHEDAMKITTALASNTGAAHD